VEITTDITTQNSARNRKTQNTKKMSNTDPTKNGGLTQMLAKGKQFLLLIRHPPCHVTHIYSTKILSLIVLFGFLVSGVLKVENDV